MVALGRVDGHDRALAVRSADIMLVPKWVGLVAVDALAAGVPIVTTRHPSHSPEFGYLVDGENAIVTPHDVQSYAATVVALLRDPGRRAALGDRGRTDSAPYSIESMAERFTEGVTRWNKSQSN